MSRADQQNSDFERRLEDLTQHIDAVHAMEQQQIGSLCVSIEEVEKDRSRDMAIGQELARQLGDAQVAIAALKDRLVDLERAMPYAKAFGDQEKPEILPNAVTKIRREMVREIVDGLRERKDIWPENSEGIADWIEREFLGEGEASSRSTTAAAGSE